MLLFVATVALAEPTVTVKFTSLPLPEALRLLSDASGQRLEAAPVLANEVLLARLREAPRPEVLRRVADVFAAEWVPKPDGTLMLRPDAAKRRAKEAASRTKERETLRGSLAYVARRLGKQPARFGRAEAVALEKKRQAEDEARKRAEEAKDYERMFRPSEAAEETPAWRALARILPTLSEAKLLAMPPSARVVWAENPTRLQNPLPIEAQRALQLYRDELAAAQPDAQPVHVRVVLTRWEHGEAHSSELIVTDPKGVKIDSAGIRLANDNERLKVPLSQRDPLPPAGNETPLTVSEELLEYGRVVNHNDLLKDPDGARLLAKWKPRLANPEKFEPTSWMPAQGYLAAAEALDRNLIGSVSDLPGIEEDEVKNRITPTQFLARHKHEASVGADGWITISPYEANRRAARDRAGAMLRGAVGAGGLSVDAAAAFAGAATEIWPFTNWVGTALRVQFPWGGGHSVLRTTADDTLLRFWDGLGRENQRLLRAGQAVDLDRLPSRAAEEFRRMIFDEERLGEGTEPTEAFAKGFGGTVRLRIEEMPILTSWRGADGEPSASIPVTASDLGRRLAVGDRYREIPAETFRQQDRFRIGLKRTYRLTFDFGGLAPAHQEELPEVFFDPKGTPVQRLPAAIAAEVEAARQKALAEPARPKDGGGTPPPEQAVN